MQTLARRPHVLKMPPCPLVACITRNTVTSHRCAYWLKTAGYGMRLPCGIATASLHFNGQLVAAIWKLSSICWRKVEVGMWMHAARMVGLR